MLGFSPDEFIKFVEERCKELDEKPDTMVAGIVNI
jgi:hypothetical protein